MCYDRNHKTMTKRILITYCLLFTYKQYTTKTPLGMLRIFKLFSNIGSIIKLKDIQLSSNLNKIIFYNSYKYILAMVISYKL